MKKTIDYYKSAIRKAERARESIIAAKESYKHECELMKNALDGDIVGEAGYRDGLAKLEAEMDAKIAGAQSLVMEVLNEYSKEMQELGRMDGSRIDDDAVKLLNSGIQLSTEEWQALAEQFKDNYTMTRLLKDKYNSQKKPVEFLTFIRFGQSPAERTECFGKFIKTLANSVNNDYMPTNGHAVFNSRTDYWNYLAKDSIQGMRPFGDESFDSVEDDFKVEYDQSAPAYTLF